MIRISKNINSAVWLLLLAVSLVQAQFSSPNPSFNPNSRSFTGTLEVTISCGNRFYWVYYTTNGSGIDLSSPSSPSPVIVNISTTSTVKAVCAIAGPGGAQNPSAVITQTYTQEAVPQPKAEPGGGYYNDKVSVKLSASSGSTLHYTLDGMEPTADSPVPPSNATITVAPTQTLKAIATRKGYANSPILTEVYTKKETVATPTCHCRDTTFSQSFEVTLESLTPNAQIYYSIDGTDPKLKTKFYTLPFKIPTATTRLRAYATGDNMNESQELSVLFTYQPKAPAPFSQPGGGLFTDSVLVQLMDVDSSVQIRYTLDGHNPTESSQLYSAPIRIDSTTRIIARSFPAAGSAKYAVSDSMVRTFKLQLSPPTADHYVNDGYFHFADSISVKLTQANKKAQILFTLSGEDPNSEKGTLLEASNPFITLTGDTTILKARSVTHDTSEQSPVVTWKYLKTKESPFKLPAPKSDPPGRDFRKSIQVFINHDSSNVEIAYTTDDSEPVYETSRKIPNHNSLNLSKTTKLKMKAFRTNWEPSETSVETFYLVPEPPEIHLKNGTITQGGIVASGTQVLLTCPTEGALIYYSLSADTWNFDKALPFSAGDTITLTSSTRIQAVAYLGTGAQQRISPSIAYDFTVQETLSDTLQVTHTPIEISPYRLSISDSTSPNVLLIVHPQTPAIPGLKLQNMVEFRPKNPGDSIHVTIEATQNSGFCLYRIVKGQAEYIAVQLPTVVSTEGIYAFGLDTLPPVIKVLSQTVNGDDNTAVRLEISDNILNPFYQYQTSQTKEWSPIVRIRNLKDTLDLEIKNAPGVQGDLWFRARSGDSHTLTFFPSDSATPFILSQGFSALSSTRPLVLGNSDYKWELVGFPFAQTTPISLRKLEEDNAGFRFKAYAYNQFGNKQQAEDTTPLMAKQGYWLAADKPLQSLKFTRVKTTPSDSDGVFRVRLHKNWNLVANPGLSTLWWPVSRQSSSYGSSQVRALWGYNHKTQDYAFEDSLSPFKGYFVYSTVSDTLIELRHKPVTPVLAKGATASHARSWSLILAEGRGELQRMPVTLGAFSDAETGLGEEDEPSLSVPGDLRQGLRSIRQGHPLISDFVAYSDSAIQTFSLAYGKSGVGQPIPEIWVHSLQLPKGLQAWAWLPQRGLKQELNTGEKLQAWTSSNDSLLIVVGPENAIQTWKSLKSSIFRPSEWHVTLRKKRDKLLFVLQLPVLADIRVEALQADGKRSLLFNGYSLGAGYHELECRKLSSRENWIRITGHDLKNRKIWTENRSP